MKKPGKQGWALFIERIADEKYPKAKRITLVMDNYITHNASSFYETFKPKEAKRLWDRLEFVYTQYTVAGLTWLRSNYKY